MWLRWTLPRLRIDQVMTTCLKYLVPISCFLFLGAAVWPLALAYFAHGETTWLPKRPLGDSVPRRVAGGTVEVTASPLIRAPEKDGSTRQLTMAARPVEPSLAGRSNDHRTQGARP
jgi:NADH-quinone oxidoreductase subunit H